MSPEKQQRARLKTIQAISLHQIETELAEAVTRLIVTEPRARNHAE